MDAPQLLTQIQQFQSNVKSALDEAKQRDSALRAKDDAQELIVIIHKTFKEVETLQQKPNMTPIILRSIGQKLDAVRPKLDKMRAVLGEEESQGQDVKSMLLIFIEI
jgi:hypothetical protein